MAEIKTRKELYDHLESTMFGTYKDIIEDGEYEKGKNLLKTYIVESNTGITALTKNLDIVIKETEDKGLYIVYSNNSKYYVDCYDPYSKNSRFWLIHTIEKSELADKFIDGIITNSMSYLDYLWMFKDKLLKLSTKHGSLRCIGVRHENSMFSKLFKGHEYVSYLSIKARGTLPKKIYDELESINALSIKNTSIEKIITSDERTTKLIEDIYRTADLLPRLKSWGSFSRV